ncbi:unnamed protein product [Linum tenue]|uniref:Uncharacterized protein n=1 Tax=Linum tenue TaxID=586396 RepID=A0AAV0LZU0_9ROSI|nr:unnamed protein product [Linum tenue]
MRGVRRHGQPRRRHRSPPRNLRALLPLRLFPSTRRRVLRSRAPGARGQLLLRHLQPPNLQEQVLHRLPVLQFDLAAHQILPLHRQSGHLPGPGRRGSRPHHRPRHHAGPPVARIVPHPRLPDQKNPVDADHRVRVLGRAPRVDRPETRRFRELPGVAVRVPAAGREDRERDGSESPRDSAARGGGGPLDAPLPLRHHGQRPGDAARPQPAPAEIGDDCGAGSQPRREFLGEVRGGAALLQRVVRRAGGWAGCGQSGAAHGGAAAVRMRDPEYCRRRRAEEDRRSEGGAVGGGVEESRVPTRFAGRKPGRTGQFVARDVSMEGLYSGGGGERVVEVGVEGFVAADGVGLGTIVGLLTLGGDETDEMGPSVGSEPVCFLIFTFWSWWSAWKWKGRTWSLFVLASRFLSLLV